MPKTRTAIIIGAGAGGLALANILAKAGYAVTVYEQNSGPGGRMGLLKKQGFTFDTGPSWYLMKEVFEHYFSLFGKTPDDYYELMRLNPAYKVFFEETNPVTIKTSLEHNRSVFEALEPGSARKLASYLEQGGKHYEAALKYFLYNPFRRPQELLRKDVVLAAPSLAGVFSKSLHKYVGQRFKCQELQQILEYPSVFLGASPFNTPALYQLMSYLDFKEGVFYPKRKGMYAVTEALCSLGKELGVMYEYDMPVQKITVEKGAATGVVVDNRSIAADLVVSNADLHFTETTLLDRAHQSYPEKYWAKRTPGPSALLLYLGIEGGLPELAHHNLFFVKAWQKNFKAIYDQKVWPKKASMYVSKTTATDSSTAPKGHENVFVLVPLPADGQESFANADDRVEHYLEQLEQMSGVHDLRRRIVMKEIRTPDYFGSTFNAWQNTALGMSHTLRQTAVLRPSVRSKKVSNLFYVGAGSQPGIGVPMCLISAQLVYKQLARDWSSGAPVAIQRLAS